MKTAPKEQHFCVANESIKNATEELKRFSQNRLQEFF
jgi:hypothetical protein